MTIKPITDEQFSKMRLYLSIYQDGSGKNMKDKTMPGWEDFEDVTELIFNGKRLKSKSVFDVIYSDGIDNIGISCKMTKTLNNTDKTVLIEHSRVNAQLFDELKKRNLYVDEIYENPSLCGEILIDLINKKHRNEAENANIALNKSFFLVMAYDYQSKNFKIFQFPVKLPRLDKFKWEFNNSQKHLRGIIEGELVIQHFPQASGQLKYYPTTRKAISTSEIFSLESLKNTRMKTIEEKVKDYFGDL